MVEMTNAVSAGVRRSIEFFHLPEPSKDHECDDVGWILSAIENSTAAFIELLTTGAAPEASEPRVVRSRRSDTSAASHSMHRIAPVSIRVG